MSIEFSKDQVLNALPAQEGKAGKFLSTDGADASWQDANGSAVVDSFALAVASDTTDDIIITKGYYTSTPGVGSATYIKTTATGTIGETDGGSYYYGTDGFKWILVHNGSVGYEQFGADATGVSDSWEAMYACHTFANTEKIPVVQNSGSFYMEARPSAPYSIPVKTNWNMTGAKIILRQASTYDANDYRYMFEVLSYQTPYTLTSAELSLLNTTYATDLNKGHIRLSMPLFADYKGAGIKITGQQDIVRSGGQVLAKAEFGELGKNGMLLSPLTKDYSDGVLACTLYPKDEGRLNINLPHFELDGVEDLRGLVIRNRHCVDIGNCTVTEVVEQPATTFRRTMFASIGCYDVHWVDIHGEAWTQTTPPEGLYLFGGNYGYNWRYTNCTSTHGWGAHGINYINQINFSECQLNRYDIHWAGHNITINNCVIPGRGVICSGGGKLSILNCRYILTPYGGVPGNESRYVVFETRIDYGSEWDGDILVDGLTVEISRDMTTFGRDFSVVTFPYSLTPTDFGRDTILGRNITVKNVAIRAEDPAQFQTINRPWVMVDYEFGYRVGHNTIIADKITVDNCNIEVYDENNYVMAYRPPAHYKDTIIMSKDAVNLANGDFNQVVNISNINNLRGKQSSYTVTDPNAELVKFGGVLTAADAGWSSRTNAIRPLINIDNCTGVVAHIAVNGNVNITNSEILGLRDVSSARPAELYVNLNNCRIRLLDDAGAANFFLPLNLNIDNSLFYPARLSTNAIHTLDFAKWSGSTGYSPVTGSGNRKADGFLSTDDPGGFFGSRSTVKTITGTTYTLSALDEDKILVFPGLPSGFTFTVPAGLPLGFEFRMTMPESTGTVSTIFSGGETVVGRGNAYLSGGSAANQDMFRVTKMTATKWFVSEPL